MVEQESDGMAQHLPKQSTRQMPEVTRPHPLNGVALCKLREDGVDAVAKMAEESAPLGMGIGALVLVGCDELDAYCGQLFLYLGRVVVAVPDDNPRSELKESSGTTESSWALAGATEMRLITPQASRPSRAP